MTAKPKSPGTTLLIDADVLRYLMAFTNTAGIDWDGDGEITEVYQVDKAKADVKAFIDEMLKKFRAKRFVLALSCPKHNFRKDVLDTYKQARHEKPKPALWFVLDEFIHETYADHIVMREGLEGDDILGLLLTHPDPEKAPGKRICISIDKDLKTIVGRHYNPMKPDQGAFKVDQYAADLFWMQQTLMGDATDNYAGCPDVGEKTAEEILRHFHLMYRKRSPEEHLAALWKVVVLTYEGRGLTEADALTQARLARILRHGDYSFKTNEVHLWKP